MPKQKAIAKSLNLQTKGMIKDLDKILKNGCTTVVVILAQWCGACKRVKPMWLNALKKKKTNNLVLIDSEVLPETSLNTLDVKYFPSTFTIPPGGNPVLLDNPKDSDDIDSTLNSAVSEPSAASEATSGVVSASQFVEQMNTPQNSLRVNTLNTGNRMNTSMRSNTLPKANRNQKPNSLQVFTPKNGFRPSLEKLKGGRRTNRNKRMKRRNTMRKS
jgi:thiol-disulfide isomerase/thioredoxin